jgi:hypothetical protein
MWGGTGQEPVSQRNWQLSRESSEEIPACGTPHCCTLPEDLLRIERRRLASSGGPLFPSFPNILTTQYLTTRLFHIKVCVWRVDGNSIRGGHLKAPRPVLNEGLWTND